MAASIRKSRGTWSRILLKSPSLKNPSIPHKNICRKIPNSSPKIHHFQIPKSNLSLSHYRFSSSFVPSSDRIIQKLLEEAEAAKQKEKDEKRKAGVLDDNDDVEEEDYMSVGPMIEKLEKQNAKEKGPLGQHEEPTDSESEVDERWEPDAVQKRSDEFEKKCNRHAELLTSFAHSETLDEAHNWMHKIDHFEQKHLQLPFEYTVIGELMNRLKDATGKERFMILQKLNRAMRMVQWKETYDPNNPANSGFIQHDKGRGNADVSVEHSGGFDKERQLFKGFMDDDEDKDFIDDKDDILMEKLNAIDSKLEEKLAALDHTFGKKGRVLEEEIKELAEEKNSLTEEKRRPLYRKGFDTRLVDMNRTCKVTKGGQIFKYTAMLVCGNYNGVIGFAKGKGPAAPIALQKACLEHLSRSGI
ncbi:uncharacterized protein LOC113356774 isoform X2 [Papaver somniferum]|uniref:uncharacterized protein LOC113356774 isoform X2 n=1 Tax=Papaver somniferum TaxID=3469 RepID=UPI000E702DD1|nr:uncharacterized protein LOC113356774 isoform X2 [Papaver somniferum]